MTKGLASYLDSVQFGRCPHCNCNHVIHFYEDFKCKTCGSDLEKLTMTREEKEALLSEQIICYQCNTCGYVGIYEVNELKICRNCGRNVKKSPIIWKEKQYENRVAQVKYWERVISSHS